MASADLELQGAVVQRLKGDAVLMSMIRGVYDQPPDGAQRPYLTIGEAQVIRDDATCVDGSMIYLTMHAWSDAVGFVEAKRIAGAVVDLLHLAPITLETARLVSLMHRQTRVFRDANGITSHAVIELVANVEKPSA